MGEKKTWIKDDFLLLNGRPLNFKKKNVFSKENIKKELLFLLDFYDVDEGPGRL